VDEVDRIAQTTEFNGIKLFGEQDKSQFVVQVGTNGSSPEENKDTISIDISGLQFGSADLGLGKENEIGPMPSDGTPPTREEIASRLNVIDTSLNRVASERATLGAVQSRLGSSINNLSISVENLSAANSRIRDVDFAEETAKLTQARVLSQSNTAVLSQANAQPEMALQLLRG
jgi:flagellin